jgi:hypothetical protein
LISKYYISLLFTVICISVSIGQEVPAIAPDQLKTPVDTMQIDSIGSDTLVLDYILSPDSLDAKIEYGAVDSMVFDNLEHKVYLYGEAFVNYTTLALKAGYIVFNLDSNIATAEGILDSVGNLTQIPDFQDGDQSFTSRKMRYNFRSKKGMIYDVVTEEGDIYIHGDKTKFVGAGADSLHTEDHIYNDGALITTCSHDEPHFGIRSRKIKTIPNKLAIIGPSNLEINGVPTPLWLPFGFFPVSSGKRSGLIFPSDYEYSETWGFGIREIGYYFPISDQMDLRVTGDIYFNGSWGVAAASTYTKRYKYRGSINLAYSSRKSEIPGSYIQAETNSFSIRVSHNQDSKAHPYRRLGGSINIQSSDYQSLNRNDANSVLTNTYSSNFSWSRTFPGKPYSLSVALSHSQNTRTNEVTINAPVVDFRLNRIYPFKKKGRSGKEKWFEKVSFQYTGNAKSKFFATDTTLFTGATLENAQFGLQHKANTDLNFKLLKFINVTPSMNYEEIWFFKTKEKEFAFDEDNSVRLDTIYNLDSTDFTVVRDTFSYGRVSDTLVSGFTPFRRFSTSISLNTQIYGTMLFKKGWLRGIRHVIKPSISFSFEPDNSMRYLEQVQTDIRDGEEDFNDYSIFEGGVYGASLTRGKRMALGYSFNNIFEAKYFSKKDSIEKKMKLFDNIAVSGNYNFAADSLHFSPVSIRGTARFFQGITTISLGATYDPYEEDENGRRIDKYIWETQRKLLRFDNASLRVNTRFSIKKLKGLFRPEKKDDKKQEDNAEEEEDAEEDRPARSIIKKAKTKQVPLEPFFDLFDNFTIGHNLAIMKTPDTTIVTTHTVNLRGNFKLTTNWSVNIGNIGYDFRSERLTYPDIGFTRNMHCWEMGISWQPVRGTYSFFIAVKPGTLDFVKIPYNRNFQDGFGGF